MLRTEPTYRLTGDSVLQVNADGWSAATGVDADGFVTHWPGTAQRVGR